MGNNVVGLYAFAEIVLLCTRAPQLSNWGEATGTSPSLAVQRLLLNWLRKGCMGICHLPASQRNSLIRA
jgi:hypothetical protein